MWEHSIACLLLWHACILDSLFDFVAGMSIYEIISQFRVDQPAPFQKSKTYKEQINPFYESPADSDVDENEAVQFTEVQ